jgi:hypothetical protein
MERTTFDSAFFYKVLDEKLGSMCATHVDDCLHAGTDQYSKLAEKTELRFHFFCAHTERFYPSECGDQCKAKRRAKQKSYPRRN